MSIIRIAFNTIYVLAFASSVAVAMKQIQASRATETTIVHHAAMGGEGRMVHLASVVR